MKIRSSVCASLAALTGLVAFPDRPAAMGLTFGSPPTVSAPVVTSPVVANAQATITCAASGSTTVNALSASVSGGTLAGGASSQAIAVAPGSSVTGTATWTAPAAGNATVTCTATNTSSQSASASTTVTVQPAPVASVAIDSMSGPSGPVLVGGTATLGVTAHDPQGGTLSYAWTASAGALQGGGATVTLTAPQTGGSVSVTVTVSSTSTSAPSSQTFPVAVILELPLGTLGDSFQGPHRIAASPEGRLYVVDGSGGFRVLTPKGESMGPVYLPDRALAVAAGPGVAYVSTLHGKILRVDVAAARVVGSFDVGYASGPMGLAYDAAANVLWLAEKDAAQLRAMRPDGTTMRVISAAGAQGLGGVTDVALDPASGLVWGAVDYGIGAPMAYAFNAADGTFARSAFTGGMGGNRVFRAGGIGVDAAGRVFVSDVYNGVVQVASSAGLNLGALGSFGSGPGELREPAGIVALPNGDVLVANSDGGRIERFGTVPSVPFCPGDSDCDGMPDWWEILHGLNPNWAGDALLDYDHDGLTNLQEFLHGTDPWNRDTDGDGVSDGDEVLAGTDPLVDDRKPVLMATDPRPSGPGLVRWSSSLARGRGTCAARWTQTGGPSVQLLGAETFTPSFVGRTAADYAFAGTATCGKRPSDPVTVTARIVDVPPRPDAGRIVVVAAGKPFALDGRFSSDANGDAFSLTWDQILGAPLVATTSGADLFGRADEPGLLGFQLTAAEPGGGLSATAEVPVLVVDSGERTPTASAVTPVLAQAGATVALDARASSARGGDVRFAWRQVDGPAVTLASALTATPSFVPPKAGRYAFDVALVSEERRSPPARVEVYAAAQGGALPTAAVAPVAAGAPVGRPLALDGSASAGASLAYRWRQVSGPAAGLTDDDAAIATVVPFAAGSYVFELTVRSGDAVGVPARVRFETGGPGGAVPKAIAAARKGPGDHWALDGSASGPVPLRYRWTQVAGPWVALDAPDSSTPSFRASGPGAYAFELEVDDGTVRSAPASVTVTVTRDGRGDDR